MKKVECPTCDGSGLVHSHNPICWTCSGTGECTEKEAKEARELEERISRIPSRWEGSYSG